MAVFGGYHLLPMVDFLALPRSMVVPGRGGRVVVVSVRGLSEDGPLDDFLLVLLTTCLSLES